MPLRKRMPAQAHPIISTAKIPILTSLFIIRLHFGRPRPAAASAAPVRRPARHRTIRPSRAAHHETRDPGGDAAHLLQLALRRVPVGIGSPRSIYSGSARRKHTPDSVPVLLETRRRQRHALGRASTCTAYSSAGRFSAPSDDATDGRSAASPHSAASCAGASSASCVPFTRRPHSSSRPRRATGAISSRPFSDFM